MLEEKKEEDSSQIIYYLSLDNSGRPKLAEDQILQAERDSILHIELMNGLEITNDITLISNAQENFPYELQEKLLNQQKITKEEFVLSQIWTILKNFTSPPLDILNFVVMF